ncbi:MAG: NAD+ kinase [Myxococcaceae bacterium]
MLVTRKTRLTELIERFNTKAQARFYLEHAGLDFDDYQLEHDEYCRSLDTLERTLQLGLPVQVLDRALVPTYLFSKTDLVVALGQDGLVANTAKYVGAQPLVGVNPDPARFDGVLLPFLPKDARRAATAVLEGRSRFREVTLAEAKLSDGQRLLAFNDFYVGARTHVSARYRLDAGKGYERQSSSGVIVSTGAGSTGWLSSVCQMASGVSKLLGGTAGPPLKMKWEDPRLVYVVREPFVSRHSTAQQTAGMVERGAQLKLESLMPSGGVLFSDGMEDDFLAFNSGVVAEVRAAPQRARLAV